MYEVEVKVRADHDRVRERLDAAGADRVGTRVQSDTYYDAPDRSFADTDEALRIRRESAPGGFDGDAGPGEEGDAGPGEEGHDGPGEEGHDGLGEESDDGPGEESDDGPGEEGHDGLGEESDDGSGEDADGPGEDDDGRAVLTYKGPKVDDVSKTREEVETPVDPDAMATVLDHLGYRAVATVRKDREVHALDGYHVTLDAVEGLGEFVEVETGATEEGIEEAREGAHELLRRLDVDPGEGIRKSYLELLLASDGRGG